MEIVFQLLKRSKKWLKIKIKEDGYNGFMKNRKFAKFLQNQLIR